MTERRMLPLLPHGSGHLAPPQAFPRRAKVAVGDTQLRANIRRATHTIRDKRAHVVDEVDDWEELREAGRALKERVARHLPELLERFEQAATAAGATVHWARDAAEANRIVTELVRATGSDEVVKVKSMVTQEIELNDALERAGITAYETDLAELIVQLDRGEQSHILVPAIHYNRTEIREIFRREMPDTDDALTSDPAVLAEAARRHLRRKFLSTKVAVSGANFAVADTGTLVVLESEGNGRMCLTLPETLISVVGIEKIVPTFADLEVFLQLLPRSSTAERMNPYTSTWTGVREGDGPQDVHIVLLDNGRSATLADTVGRQALACIRCSACLNVCPVYERTGGIAYGSVYPGPIGAIISPQLTGVERNKSLPYASSLCGACYDVCPVKINIPEVLVHLRQTGVDGARERPSAERTAMRTLAWVMSDQRRYENALRAARTATGPIAGLLAGKRTPPGGPAGTLGHLPWPLSAWTVSRDAPLPARQSFRDWWRKTHGEAR
ncbi:LutB/LldF family L-lactate oxidation iron-sulfur protein [Actinocatenispora rupis]|uniref:Iron-sulfur cluster-binding protein n=1 Tax=Actinocatenispora rupis TaxID=519421 RepID=A0A8J3IZ47_9ACTN|nr:LutB/LldF family L-lactate oxidation iron-sulfur protein [Actinocatenispora rupis]GID11288.1 iron-sulfur cluster-binding protein [Actinocatenispora rupis]